MNKKILQPFWIINTNNITNGPWLVYALKYTYKHKTTLCFSKTTFMTKNACKLLVTKKNNNYKVVIENMYEHILTKESYPCFPKTKIIQII